MALGSDEAHVIDDPSLAHPLVQARQGGGPFGSRGPADDGQTGVAAPASLGDQGLEGQVHPLEGLEAADEEQHGLVDVAPEGLARRALVARGEEGVLHAQGHHVHPRGVGVVVLDELGGLDVAAGEHRVGAGEDGGLLVGAVLRLALEVIGLHPLEGVKGHQQRDVQLVLEAVPGESAQPVVGVDGVGAAVRLDVGGHLVGEGLDVVAQLLAAQDARGSGVQVVHPETRLHDLRGALLARVAPREDVDLVTLASEGARELAHVDVHAPAVAGPGLRQGRGVVREDAETSHATSLPVKTR